MDIKPKSVAYFTLAYFGIRLFSYFFNPPTPLLAGSVINTLVSLSVLALAVYWLIKNDARGWLIVAGEIILCGSGNILSIGSISLRTALLVFSLAIYFAKTIKAGRLREILSAKSPNLLIFALLAWAFVSAAIGISRVHDSALPFLFSSNLSGVVSDLIPYLFLLYYFPLADLLKNESFKQNTTSMIVAAIFSNAAIIIASLFSFTSGFFVLQNNYYHWFRDVAGGKITGIFFDTYSYFRIVLDEHLALVPILLCFIWREFKEQKFVNRLVLFAGAAIISINLTRIYILALLAGLVFLFSRKYFGKWLLHSVIIILSIYSCFTAFNLIASNGKNPGWGYFGFRMASIASPMIEESSESRILLLPEIFKKIVASPVVGQGLGDTVIAYSSAVHKYVATPHFDWGYLEILAEMGAVGLALWLALLIALFRRIKKAPDNRPAHLAALISLLVINITSPALFHVFGFIILAFLFASSNAFPTQYGAPLHNPAPILSPKASNKQNAVTSG